MWTDMITRAGCAPWNLWSCNVPVQTEVILHGPARPGVVTDCMLFTVQILLEPLTSTTNYARLWPRCYNQGWHLFLLKSCSETVDLIPPSSSWPKEKCSWKPQLLVSSAPPPSFISGDPPLPVLPLLRFRHRNPTNFIHSVHFHFPCGYCAAPRANTRCARGARRVPDMGGTLAIPGKRAL